MTITSLTSFVHDLVSQPLCRDQVVALNGNDIVIVVDHIGSYYADLLPFTTTTSKDLTGWYDPSTMTKVDIGQEKLKYPERFI